MMMLCVSLLCACRIKLYVPTAENTTSDVALDELNRGRALYVDKCSNCHDLHFPEEYDYENWEFELNKMQPRAKIKDEERELILKYLWNAPQKKKRKS